MVFLAGYYQLGGFKPINIELVKVDDYRLVGKSFEGSFRSDSIRIYFNEMKSLVQQGTVQGQPTIIYDQEPDGTKGFSRSFIGILLEKDNSAPAHLEQREISTSRAIRVSKDAHISVMPNPDKIAKRIEQYSRQHQVQPMGPSIEIYRPENRLVIEQPVFVKD